MKKNPALLASIVFSLIGGIFVALSGYMYIKDLRFKQTAVTSTGTVVEYVQKNSSDGYTYSPVVVFTDQQGKEVRFQSRVSSSYQSYVIGETVPVLYNPMQSSDAKIDGFITTGGFWILFGGFGSIFFVIGVSMLLRRVLRNIEVQKLKQTGTRVDTIYQSVEKSSLRVNDKPAYHIFVQWNNPADGKLYTFKSDAIWYNPEPYLTAAQNIPVLVDMGNLKNYWVDVSFLPGEGN